MRLISANVFQGVRYLVDANFYLSLIIIVFGSVFSMTQQYAIFDFNVDLYGELANNLRAIMCYLAVSEVFLFLYCFLTKQYQHFILAGFFLLVTIGSIEFYSQVNGIETDPNLDICLLYAGLSHIVFGFMAAHKNDRDLAAEKEKSS